MWSRREKSLTTNEGSLRGLWDNVKRTHMHIIGVPEGHEGEKGTENILQEIIAKNVPHMGKEPLTQIQQAQQAPYKTDPRRNTLRHILIKLTEIKDKEKILKAAREKNQVTHKGTLIRLFSAGFSAETLQARREGHDRLNLMKGKNLQPRWLYPARLSFRFEGESKTFTDKQKQREFSNTKRASQQILKELLWAEKKRQQQETNLPQRTRLTGQGMYTAKIRNHPCAIIPPKSELRRRGGCKCRTLEMNLQWREQQLKTTSHTYRLSYQNLRIPANQKPTVETQTRHLWQEIYLIVKKCIIPHAGGHLTSFVECRSLLTSDSDFLSIKEFMLIIIK